MTIELKKSILKSKGLPEKGFKLEDRFSCPAGIYEESSELISPFILLPFRCILKNTSNKKLSQKDTKGVYMTVLSIIWNDILPLLVFVWAGWFLDSRFKLDLGTYSKLIVLVMLPCFIFFNLYRYEGSEADLLLLPAAILLMILQYILSAILGHGLGLGKEVRDEFKAVSTFSNSGHIGAALIMLIFTHPPFSEGASHPYLAQAMGAMAILMIVMNICVNVFGAALIRSRGASISEFFLYLLKMPALYAAVLAFILKMAEIPLQHTFLWPVFIHFNGAFFILVTITIGIQLHRSRLQKPDFSMISSMALKLILMPLLAFGILEILGSGLGIRNAVAEQVFFLFAAIPSSMTLIIYGAEYKEDSSYLTQSVLFNTVCGIITVTGAIYISRLLFPLGM